jgi:hypothetical protein
MTYAMMLFSSISGLIRFYITFVIVTVLLAPVAYEAASAVGHSQELSTLLLSLRRGQVVVALRE